MSATPDISIERMPVDAANCLQCLGRFGRIGLSCRQHHRPTCVWKALWLGSGGDRFAHMARYIEITGNGTAVTAQMIYFNSDDWSLNVIPDLTFPVPATGNTSPVTGDKVPRRQSPGRYVQCRLQHCTVLGKSPRLRRKLHHIPPLRHVLNFLALVNFVNQFRSVVDQPHGRFARYSCPA